jgi:hypothetical protein
MHMTRLTLLVAVVLGVCTAAVPALASNTAILSNVQLIDNHDSSWTLAFDLTNSGPARDAVFSMRISGLPTEWTSVSQNAYAVWGLGPTVVDLADGFKYSWDGSESGPAVSFECTNGSTTGWYRIYGQPNAPSPNKHKGTSARFMWTFNDGGYSPAQFQLTQDMLKIHMQQIDGNWSNNGSSYVSDVLIVPEPSSFVALLGLASSGLAMRRRSVR